MQNKDIRDRIVFREDDWFRRDVFENTVPPENTRIVYICYFPEYQIVKVGKTVNWKSRKNTYKRGDGNSPETRSLMKLLYWYPIPKVGDDTIDDYLLTCLEGWLIKEAHKEYNIFEGKEFFKGNDNLTLIDIVNKEIGKLTISNILSQRTDYQIKRFCKNPLY